MSNLKRFIRSTMDFDPVAEAESMIGGPVDQTNVGVAISFSQDKANLMERLMTQTGDVHSRMSFDAYCEVVVGLGFALIYEQDFQGSSAPETFRVYWHSKGFLLKLESYNWGDQDRHVNSANIYYNVKIEHSKRSKFWSECTSSGGYVVHNETTQEYIWAGHNDAREALRFTMEALSQHEVLPVWVKAPHLWLITYEESRTQEGKPYSHRDYDSFNRQKIDKFPTELRDMLLASRKE